jgi:hypothetical protein
MPPRISAVWPALSRALAYAAFVSFAPVLYGCSQLPPAAIAVDAWLPALSARGRLGRDAASYFFLIGWIFGISWHS